MTPRRAVAISAAVVVAGAALSGGAPAGAAQAPPPAGPTQELAVVLTPHAVKPTLHTRGSRVTLAAWAPITGAQTVVPVIGHATQPGGIRWLRVMLPGRPNGSTGWITQRGTQKSTTSWRVSIRTSTRAVRVYRRGRLVRSFAAVVGKPSTPTPTGRFFVEESILMPRGSPGAPYALALSARSNVLQEFEGGPGQIAMHGVANLGGTPGTAISHGCVRLADADIRWLAAHIAPGVRVSITA